MSHRFRPKLCEASSPPDARSRAAMLAVAEMGANTSELLRLLHVERALRERAESDARRATQLLLQPRRSLWKPKRRVAVCNGSGHTDHPLVSAIVQTFGDGSNARQLTTRLHAALPAAQLEVIINDDSGRDHGRWLALLRQPNDFVVSSPNIHEIRAYNRLARLARGDFLLLLQGDHCLPGKPNWLRQAPRNPSPSPSPRSSPTSRASLSPSSSSSRSPGLDPNHRASPSSDGYRGWACSAGRWASTR